MATLPEIESQMKAEAWKGAILQIARGTDGTATRYHYAFLLASAPSDTANKNSDLNWRLRQSVIVNNEGEAGETAYFEGIWRGPLYNAFLRWIEANMTPNVYYYNWTFITDARMQFWRMDVSSGSIEEQKFAGVLDETGELQVTAIL